MKRITRQLLLAATVTLAVPASAQAAVSFTATPTSTKAASKLTLHVRVATTASCRLTAPGIRSSAVPAAGQQELVFSWKLPSTARSGRYRITVRCGNQQAAVSVRVRGTRHGVSKLGPAPVTVKRIATPPAVPTRPTPTPVPAPTAAYPVPAPTQPQPAADPAAQAESWYQHLVQLNTGTGQCTEYAMQKRPDIFRAINYPRALQWAQAGMTADTKPAFLGDAWTWTGLAQQTPGAVVSDLPTVGALVNIQPGTTLTVQGGTMTWPADSPGHLGYVESVSGDGSFVFSQFAFTGGPVNTVTVKVAPSAGMTFISLAS